MRRGRRKAATASSPRSSSAGMSVSASAATRASRSFIGRLWQDPGVARTRPRCKSPRMTVRPQDLSGRRGFGPVPIERDEPVFHAHWEASVIAGILATIAAGLYNVDQFREGIDDLEPLSYLSLGYYGRWLHTLEVNCVKSEVFTDEELEQRIEQLASGGEAPDGPNREIAGQLRDLIYFSTPAARRPGAACLRGRRPRARQGARRQAPRAHPGLRPGPDPASSSTSSRPSPSRTRTGSASASAASTCTRCASRRATCGTTPGTRAQRSSSTCGSRTSRRPR